MLLAQITPDQIDMLSRLSQLPLTALLIGALIVDAYVIYTLWQRIVALETRIEQILSGFRNPNQSE